MTDTVVAAWITVGGTMFVAIVSILTQLFITRFVIKSEHRKVAQQIEAERRSQTRQKRADILLEAVAQLLAETDPQVKARFSYGQVVTLIHRSQLVLNPEDTEEAALNNAINHLGLELQRYIPHHEKPVEGRLTELQQMLRAHAQVATLAGKVLRR